ncbi:DUF4247 domain-containing protein [Bacillus aerolatus]|uniref:DUF4247 domain-containing protein n=1 Tax=Bacillus aerolatus TaxID=2653354 RepID=A0A6I1FGV6_9BACI|nr:DUF4247 domain-containing protein [Bacillus aerolatus]KAB7704777.1 DUF4247 domain-containing protein [Bacillus aerolatus]
MKKRLFLLFALFAAAAGLLAGCGSAQIEDYISDRYSLIDVVRSQDAGIEDSYVYLAEDQQVKEVADELIQVQKPDETGKYVSGKQVLIYDDQFVILTEAPDQPDQTLIEVSDQEFVRSYYHPGFFQGMLLGHMLSNMFGGGWDRYQRGRCGSAYNNDCYGGYGSTGRWNSGAGGRGSTFRGGGPGTGK